MWAEWSTAQIALIVSALSFLLSFAGFIWNVWSKFIFPKPRIEVTLNTSMAIGGEGGQWPDALTVSAINHGPIPVTLRSVDGRVMKWIWQKPQHAVLRCYKNWPYSSKAELTHGIGLRVKLDVGDVFSVHIVRDLGFPGLVDTIGFSDGFGRTHFAKSSRRGGLESIGI